MSRPPVRAIGSRVTTADGHTGYVTGRSKRRGRLYLTIRMANGANYVYRAEDCRAAGT